MTSMTHKWELRGEKRGEQKGKRHLILRAYQQKFGVAPLPILNFVQRVTDLNRLDEMFDQLLNANSADQLHAPWYPRAEALG